ncbi:MAG: BatA domain-containing protein, partial [Candidatus Binatia bacterium]
MNLSFLSPLAFQLLYALPLLFLPYLLRNREKEVIVPALFLYQGLPTASRRRLWGRLQLTRSFFLQLLILLLMIAAAAQPFLHGQGGKIALVLDTSASMQARSPDGTGSLFALAKQHAGQALATIPASDSISLFVSTPFPKFVTASSEDRGNLRTELSLTETTDAPDAGDEVLSAFFSNLLKEQGFQHVFFFTDRSLTAPATTNAFTAVTLGGPQANLGITSFRLYRSPFEPDEVDATITITGMERSQDLTISIEDADIGKQLVSRSFTNNKAADFSFSRLPLAKAYRARLNVEDGLALDNEAYAVLPSLTNVSVLLVSPSANVASSLNAIPNLKLERLTPQEYTPEKAARFAFVLFHLATPESLPPTNAAFLLPPEGNALFPLDKATNQVQVTQWMTAHPLTSYVTFSLFTPAYAEALQPVDWCQPIVQATVGPIVLAGEREGRRYVATGFDLLQYLGKRNLPISIFK